MRWRRRQRTIVIVIPIGVHRLASLALLYGELKSLWVHLGGLCRLALRSLRLVSRIIVDLLNHMHLVAMVLVLLSAANAAASTSTASAEVARGEAARALPTTLDAAAGAAEDDQ